MSDLKHDASQPDSIWHNNPIMVKLLGLSPVLAISSSLVNGITLSLGMAIILVASSLTIASCRGVINPRWRLVWFLVVSASYSTVLDICMQWYYFPLHKELGPYVLLLSCNFIVLIHLEVSASKLVPLRAAKHALVTAVGFAAALLILSATRELLGTGQLLHDWQLLIPNHAQRMPTPSTEFYGFASKLPAAFIILGLLIAAKNVLGQLIKPTKKVDSEPVTRARVTGRI